MASQDQAARRLLVVSNRLPFTVVEQGSDIQIKESSGGLVTGLGAYLDSLKTTSGEEPDYLWVGWPGSTVSDELKEKVTAIAGSEFRAHPVFISEEEMDDFYFGFCNKTIWPLFHYFPTYAVYNNEYWEVYRRVNERFCETVAQVMRPGDLVWIQDYQLMLLPSLIRERMPDAQIGFFLHIPFPSFELYRLFPKVWCMEILKGLLGADLVGFHTHDYTQYFLRSVMRVLGYEHNMGQILAHDRIVRAETFPMGIDYDKFHKAALSPQVQEEKQHLKSTLGDVKLVLSIDRLDYSKGIINRLEGFECFLENNPHWHRKVVLSLVVIPSRVGVEHYQQTKEQIEVLVGRINGRFGDIDWAPIRYQYRSLPFESLVALYGASDVALVTPLRDGMNLIAKEYIASRPDATGVLVLSEMAGAAKELGEAVIINPNSREEIGEALRESLEMPEQEQVKRNQVMQERLRRYNVVSWAEDFIRTMRDTREIQERASAKLLTPPLRDRLVADFANAERRLIFLDYDGTLVPFAKDPQAVRPTQEVLDVLKRLADDPVNRVVLVSGRDTYTLQEWFGGLNMVLVGEHGAWIRPIGEGWRLTQPLTNEWKPNIRPVLELYVDRLPGSFIEEKMFSLAWHYRAADRELGPVRAKELLDHLVSFTANIDVQVLQGNKVIEIKSAGVNKGTSAMHLMSGGAHDFILAIGDDWTDEYLFAVLPETAYSIRVGMVQTQARFNLRDYGHVLQLLGRLAAVDEEIGVA